MRSFLLILILFLFGLVPANGSATFPVTIRVEDASGAVTKEVLVIVQDLDHSEHEILRTLSDQSGNVPSLQLSPGLYRVIATAPYGIWETSVSEFLVGSPPNVVIVKVQPMPTHGYGLFRSLLLGSVTAKVLHDTPCTVWTGVHIEDSPAVPPQFRTILCAVDRTDDIVPTMRFACRLAQDNHAKLFLVHAIPGSEVAPDKYFDTDLRTYLEEDARKTIAQLQESAGVVAPLCLGAGEVSHVVRDAALAHNADLLVIGRGRATRTLGRLRSNVYSIIRDAPCPVISV